MSSPSKRHSHRHSGGSRSGGGGSGSGKKLRRMMPKFSDNPPAQHEIVDKKDCDISSSDDTSPAKTSNGHATSVVAVAEDEEKVSSSIIGATHERAKNLH